MLPRFSDWDGAIAAIVALARKRNAAKGITGALACTRDYFAQLLWGLNAVINELMYKNDQDDRHTDLTVLRVLAITRRQLPNWSMAYLGPSSYVAAD